MRRASPAIPALMVAALASVWPVGNADAQSQASTKLVAVLPLDMRQAEMDAATRVALEESIRTVAGEGLYPLGYTVLTGETTLAILAENGIDPEQACETSCALDTARQLSAELFISGTVAFTEGFFTAFIRLYDSRTGQQKGSLELEGKTVREVRRAFSDKADEFFRRFLGPPASTPQPAVVQPAVTQPASPAATTPAAPAPRTNAIPDTILGSIEKADPKPTPLPRRDVPPSPEPTPAPIAAWLTVLSEAPGVTLSLDGEIIGTTPIHSREVRPGVYTLAVADDCYHPWEERLVLAFGDQRTVAVRAEPRAANIRIEATDGFGNPVVATASANGRQLGRVPGMLKVPVCANRIDVESSAGRWSGNVSFAEGETGVITARLSRDGAVAGPVEVRPTQPPQQQAPRKPANLALRAGTGAATGWVGASLEYRTGWLGYSVGLGLPSLTVGLTFADSRRNGGLYAEAHIVFDYLLTTTGFGGFYSDDPSIGFAATVGWDWRFFDLVTLKTGIGVIGLDMIAYSDDDFDFRMVLPVVDLAVGIVF